MSNTQSLPCSRQHSYKQYKNNCSNTVVSTLSNPNSLTNPIVPRGPSKRTRFVNHHSRENRVVGNNINDVDLVLIINETNIVDPRVLGPHLGYTAPSIPGPRSEPPPWFISLVQESLWISTWLDPTRAISGSGIIRRLPGVKEPVQTGAPVQTNFHERDHSVCGIIKALPEKSLALFVLKQN